MNSLLKLIFATCILACFTNTEASAMRPDGIEVMEFADTATNPAFIIQSDHNPATLLALLLRLFRDPVHIGELATNANVKQCLAEVITEWAESGATPAALFDRRRIAALLVVMIRQFCDIGRTSQQDLDAARFVLSIRTNRRAIATSTAAVSTCRTMMSDCGRWNNAGVPAMKACFAAFGNCWADAIRDSSTSDAVTDCAALAAKSLLWHLELNKNRI